MEINSEIEDKDFVHIWTCNINSSNIPKSKIQSVFSATELSRVKAFNDPEDKNRYINAHFFLRNILSKYTSSSPENIEFFYSPHYEKPFIDSSFNINFNLSYRNDWALLAITDQAAVGADIEMHIEINGLDTFASNFFSEKERRWLNSVLPGSEQNKRFFTVWTLKEAYMKATGEGLSMQSQDFSIIIRNNEPILDLLNEHANAKWILKEISAPDSYSAAIAIKKNIGTPNIIVQNFPILDLSQVCSVE
ncbi:MAG TPA: 4'-phosphopantetheinyl transferase superfamily protein [Flavipsychrobacter sp.]|nr:4'-phosphopantetheinyl transferase superfamily protein [Flavipsychrobacter sp.]